MAKSVWAMKEADIKLHIFGDETGDPRPCLFSLRNSLNQDTFIEVLVTPWAFGGQRGS
jgi:hypothetical protein